MLKTIHNTINYFIQEMDFASEILDCLKYGRADKNYSENVRQFSIALSYYSPNAYRYIRSVFQRHLPDPRTMRLWMSSIDASPGITNEALKVLYKKCTKQMEKSC